MSASSSQLLLAGRPRGDEGAGDAGGAVGPPREVAAADGAEVEDEEEGADGPEDEEEREAGDDAQGAVRATDGEEGEAAEDGEDREEKHQVLVALLATCKEEDFNLRAKFYTKMRRLQGLAIHSEASVLCTYYCLTDSAWAGGNLAGWA